jgi:hypothetical protein
MLLFCRFMSCAEWVHGLAHARQPTHSRRYFRKEGLSQTCPPDAGYTGSWSVANAYSPEYMGPGNDSLHQSKVARFPLQHIAVRVLCQSTCKARQLFSNEPLVSLVSSLITVLACPLLRGHPAVPPVVWHHRVAWPPPSSTRRWPPRTLLLARIKTLGPPLEESNGSRSMPPDPRSHTHTHAHAHVVPLCHILRRCSPRLCRGMRYARGLRDPFSGSSIPAVVVTFLTAETGPPVRSSILGRRDPFSPSVTCPPFGCANGW